MIQNLVFLGLTIGLDNPKLYHVMTIMILVFGSCIPLAIWYSSMIYLAVLTGSTFIGAVLGIIAGMVEAPDTTWWVYLMVAYTMLGLGLLQVIAYLHDKPNYSIRTATRVPITSSQRVMS